jgi:hypothetical protein
VVKSSSGMTGAAKGCGEGSNTRKSCGSDPSDASKRGGIRGGGAIGGAREGRGVGDARKVLMRDGSTLALLATTVGVMRGCGDIGGVGDESDVGVASSDPRNGKLVLGGAGREG